MKRTEYYNEFINAIERTKEWGLNPGEIALDRKGKFLTENSAVELLKLLEMEFDGVDEGQMMVCTKVSVAMLELVKNHFNTDAYLTTGNLMKGETLIFDCSLDYLKILLNEDEKFKNKLKVHVWITLSSGEIIDFTFFRSMTVNFPYYRALNNAVITDSILEKHNLKYIPMLVGDDFYKQTGNLK